jgi:hypothetical protein
VKRLFLCVFLLIWAGACQRLDRRTFNGLEKASRALQTAVDGQTSLPTYRQLLSTYASELAAVRGRVTNGPERAVLAEYEAALKGLNDLQLVWEDKEVRGSEMLPVRDELPARIAREYELGVNTNEPPSIYATEASHRIWEVARSHLEKAGRALGLSGTGLRPSPTEGTAQGRPLPKGQP